MSLVEEWRPVKSFEGFYEVSNLGEVRSLDRTVFVTDRRWGGSYFSNIKGRVLKPSNQNRLDYIKYCLIRNETPRKEHYTLGHRLVAEAFIANPNNYPVVHHLDHNKRNNRADNLEWYTSKHNSQAAAKAGRMATGNIKILTEDQIFWIEKFLEDGANKTHICEIFNIPQNHLERVLTHYKIK